MRELMSRLFRPMRNWWAGRRAPTRELPHVLLTALRNFSRYGSRQSAALAFYSLFSAFPLTLLVAVVVSGLLEPAVAQEQIANGLSRLLPAETVTYIQEVLDDSLQQASSFGVVAILALVWSSLTFFSNLTASLDEIFDVPERRGIWSLRALAVLMSITLVILVVVSFLTSGVLRLVSILLLDQPSLWVSVGSLFLPIGLDVVIFAMLFRFVPARFVHWDAVLPAAIFGAIGWELAKAGFAYYLNNLAGFQFIYGGIATAIVLLFWANLIAAIFLLSAEFCARLNEWIIRQDTGQPGANKSYSIAIRNGQIEVRTPEERRFASGK